MKRTKIIALALCCMLLLTLLVGCGGKSYQMQDYVLSYEIGDKDSFHVLQLSDIHVANKDDRQRQFNFLQLTFNKAKQSVGVDMIVVTGDLFTFADRKTAKELFAFFDSLGVPWTVTFGNHDEQCYFSIDWLTGYLNKLTQSPDSNCLFVDKQDDDVFGNANFAINLTKNGQIWEQMIIMDSNRYHYGVDYIGYDYIRESQVEWYKSLVNYTTAQNNGNVVDSMMFFHIPLPDWNVVYDAVANGTTDAQGIEICNDGVFGEGISSPDVDINFFDVIQSLGSTKAISVGHDHVSNLIAKYKGIYLCYGVNSTDRIYFDDSLLGGRVITVNADHSFAFADVTNQYSEY